MAAPLIELNDGNKMPQVGFGLWKVENEKCADLVYTAIKNGYRKFDGACGMSFLIPFLSQLNRLFSLACCFRSPRGNDVGIADSCPSKCPSSWQSAC